jgi:hypothetical protein
MPLRFQRMITREDIQANPDTLYVFGDNLARYGKGGQAAEMRGEPNAVGVVTKKLPKRTPDAYMSDDDLEENVAAMRKDLERVWEALRAGKVVVFPMAGIGTDRAELKDRAPKTNAALQKMLKETRRIAEENTPEGWQEVAPTY